MSSAGADESGALRIDASSDRKYRTEDYYRQIDGLGYIEVVSQATGESAN